jgi:methylmalonyl-CoA/ethylmalonyl-CoA epimerase
MGAIHHVAVVVRSIDESLPRYRRLLGWQPDDEPFVFAPQGVRLCFLSSAGGGARIELVEPVDAESGVARYLESQGEGVHHVCLVSDDLPADLAALAVAEAELIDREPRAGAHGRVAFIHPRTLNGVLWELVEQVEHEETHD